MLRHDGAAIEKTRPTLALSEKSNILLFVMRFTKTETDRKMTKTECLAYNCVRRGIARTRAELSKVMDISRPTASTVAESLIESGFLRDGGKGHSSGGRNPMLLLVRSDAFSLVGVDLGLSNRISGVLVNASGRIIRSCDMPLSSDTPGRIAEAVAKLWESLDSEYSACGIGLAVPGAFDAATGTVSRCDRTGFGGNELIRMLRKRFVGKFVYAASRLQTAAASESFGGAVDQKKSFMLLALDDGIEASFCIEGRCFAGAHGMPGDLGNLPTTSYDGSSPTTLGEALSFETLARVRPNAEQLADVCAGGLKHVLSVIDIGTIVLNGRFGSFDGEFTSLLERRLARFDCEIKQSAFGRFSSARGAALQTHIGV